ncbi:LPP20 family lipoprotein [Marinomonas sp. IMCC 4694]|uniref:LPP20 family lipoprotein n=1 Tax=Marinomonas sp. IMCC 4694 TaxID=2605432 RepID=UPI0011E74760|nr:LPP20 family lipoprotein [Marinomonas sp. IMCC 4694]TYL48716.1 hypothetical protein FXV75_12715 [Marinomonas sp. IMCC 4694]
MTTTLRFFLLALGAVILTGCQNLSQPSASGEVCTTVSPCNGNAVGNSSTTAYTQNNVGSTTNTIRIIKQEPILVTATGYAAAMTNKRLSASQARILSLRSSMLDAYRNLSERVYGLKIDGSSSLSNMVMQNDELRTYVDAYLVGAKVVSQREHEDGTFETVVEMALQENFRECLTSSSIQTDPNCKVQPGYRTLNVQNTTPTSNFYSIE